MPTINAGFGRVTRALNVQILAVNMKPISIGRPIYIRITLFDKLLNVIVENTLRVLLRINRPFSWVTMVGVCVFEELALSKRIMFSFIFFYFYISSFFFFLRTPNHFIDSFRRYNMYIISKVTLLIHYTLYILYMNTYRNVYAKRYL